MGDQRRGRTPPWDAEVVEGFDAPGLAGGHKQSASRQAGKVSRARRRNQAL